MKIEFKENPSRYNEIWDKIKNRVKKYDPNNKEDIINSIYISYNVIYIDKKEAGIIGIASRRGSGLNKRVLYSLYIYKEFRKNSETLIKILFEIFDNLRPSLYSVKGDSKFIRRLYSNRGELEINL